MYAPSAADALGFSIPQLAVLVDAIYEARVSEPDPERLFELILTGPHMQGAEVTSTETMFHRMVDLAQDELIIAGYAFYNGKAMFSALAAKMQANPDFKVTFCVNIERKEHDTTADIGLIEKFKYVFSTYNWPTGCRLPNIYYFPPSQDERHRESRDALQVRHHRRQGGPCDLGKLYRQRPAYQPRSRRPG
jgi:hypothetical protein